MWFYFIVSEVMFFFAFFWAYFHSSLAPAIEIGSIWPPAGIPVFKSLGRSSIEYAYIIIIRRDYNVCASCIDFQVIVIT